MGLFSKNMKELTIIIRKIKKMLLPINVLIIDLMKEICKIKNQRSRYILKNKHSEECL